MGKSRRDAEEAQEKQRLANEKFEREMQERPEGLQRGLHEDGKSDGWNKLGAGAVLGAAGTAATIYASNDSVKNTVDGFLQSATKAAGDYMINNPPQQCSIQ